MYCTDLEDLILKKHHQNKADELLILGGFISYLPVQQISNEKINTTIVYGCMKNANLNEMVHKKYSKSKRVAYLYFLAENMYSLRTRIDVHMNPHQL